MAINWDLVLGKPTKEKEKEKGIDWDFVLSTPETPQQEKKKLNLPNLMQPISNIQQAGKSKIQNEKLANFIYGRDPEVIASQTADSYNTMYEKSPFLAGAITGAFGKNVAGAIDGTDETLARVKEEHPKKFGAGALTGGAAMTAAKYQFANPLASKIPGINKIPSEFWRTQGAMLGADTLVNLPSTLVSGALENKSAGEMAKDFMSKEATDAAFNLAIGGIGHGIKKLKDSKTPVENVSKDITEPLKKKLRINQAAPKVTDATMSNKNLDSAKQEWDSVKDQFTEFRKWINNGAFGKEASQTEMDLFKEQTGIDVGDILKRIDTAQDASPQKLLRSAIEKRRLGEVAGVYEPIMSKKAQAASTTLNKLSDGFKETKPLNIAEVDFVPKKDIKPVNKNFKDFYRNMKDVYGEKYDVVKDSVIKPFNEAKKKNVDMQKEWLDMTHDYVVKKLNIKKGSKLSALVQRFGEGNISEAELRQMLSPEDVQRVMDADTFFRNAYDDLLKTVNTARAAAYPNNPDMLITPRENYYRHFQDLSGSYIDKIKKVMNLSDEAPNMKDKGRKALSSYFSIGKQRTADKAIKEDAVAGFIDYVQAASYATNIDTQIPMFRKLAADINKAAPGEYNNLVNYINEFADDLSGSQNWLDKGIQNIIGKKQFTILDKLNKRIKSNVVMGNISSSLSQIANVPQGIATIKDPRALTIGASDTLLDIVSGKTNAAQQQSGFLSERYIGKLYDRFDTKLIDQPKKFASWMLEVLDEVGTKYIWNSAYRKAVLDGVQAPIEYADELTRNMVAGRGIGELPLIQKSKVFQMLAPFQVEVANLWHVQKDMIKEKDFGGLLILYIANNIMNKGLESIRGSGATFDPIDALQDAFTDENKTPMSVAGRLSGEVLSNLPLGQTAATLVPENKRQQFFGNQDPTRYGTDDVMIRALQRPVTDIMLPWGGGQVRKSIKGLQAAGKLPELNPFSGDFGKKVDTPGAYSGTGSNKKLRYPIGEDPKSQLQAAIFGPASTPTARDYYKESRRPLSVNQTRAVQAGADYQQIQHLRRVEGLKRKIQDVASNEHMSAAKKEKEINKLIAQIEKILNNLEN